MNRRGTSPVLIGRATEMAALDAALDAVSQGSPAALLIGGEAGVGKSRLLSEFTSRVRASGARVVYGECLELGADGLPFGPFTAMLRDLVRKLGAEAITGLLPGGNGATRELARLLPELAGPENGTAIGGGPGLGGGLAGVVPAAGELAGGPAGAASEARARLFEEFLTLFERLAEAAPLVLVIEDAHWADRSSRDLIAFLTGYQRALRSTLLIVTFRSDELHRTHPLRPLLAELARIEWVTRLELPRLTSGQAAEMVAAIRGDTPDPDLVEQLYRRAEGNPLFTEELLGGSCADGMLTEIPDSLADLLLQAVRRLPEDTQEVLRVASAGNGSISHALLARVTKRGDEDLSRALRPAVTGNVLVTTSDGYAFRHALIREAVHEDLLPGEHGQVHARYAEVIDADPALVPEGRAGIEKAHHWHAAHDTTWALIAAWQATAQPSHAVAYAERLMLLARVLELWPQVPDAAERIGTDHVRVLEEAVAVARDAGEDKRGMAFTAMAIAELDESAEPTRLARMLGRRGFFRENLGIPGAADDFARALQLISPERMRADRGTAQIRIELLLESARYGLNWTDPDLLHLSEEALRFAREVGDLTSESQALGMLALAKASPAGMAVPDSEPMRLLRQSREIAQRVGAYQPLLKAVTNESHFLCGAGDYQRAADVARQAVVDAERYGLARTKGAFVAINVAEPLYALGRWDEALEVAERALGLSPAPRTRTGLWLISGAIELARGNLAAAVRRAAASESVLSGLRYTDQFHLEQARLEVSIRLASGDPAAAVAFASDALERCDLPASGHRYVWPLLVTALDAVISAGAAAGAAAADGDLGVLTERLHTLAEKTDAFGPVQEAWRLMFLAADPLADPAGLPGGTRLAGWDAAAAGWETVKDPYLTATTLAAGAREALGALSMRGTPDSGTAGTGTRPKADDRAAREEAATRLRRAARLAADLGARPLSEQIAILARRAGISLAVSAGETAGGHPGSGHSPGTAPLALTSREYEVLRLLTAGQSNREIAAALFISPKTASVHVSNILGKLGVASRTEAAAKAHALRLFEESPR